MHAFSGLAFVRVHQMAPPRTVVTTSSCSLLLIYRPRKDERLSWPSWLTYSGRFTHISGHPSAVGRAQDSESLLVTDQRSTAEPQNQLSACDRRTDGQRQRTPAQLSATKLQLTELTGFVWRRRVSKKNALNWTTRQSQRDARSALQRICASARQ